MSTTFSQHFYNKFEVAGYYWLLHVTAKNESQWQVLNYDNEG